MELYHHWLDRQGRGLIPFEVIGCHPKHDKALKKSEKGKGKVKAKPKPEYMDVSTDEEEEEKLENYPVTPTAKPSTFPPPKPAAKKTVTPTAGPSTLAPPKPAAKKNSANVEESPENEVEKSFLPPVKIGPPKRRLKMKNFETAIVEDPLKSKSSSSKSKEDDGQVWFYSGRINLLLIFGFVAQEEERRCGN